MKAWESFRLSIQTAVLGVGTQIADATEYSALGVGVDRSPQPTFASIHPHTNA